jgi:hypothetical protein
LDCLFRRLTVSLHFFLQLCQMKRLQETLNRDEL